MPTRISQGLGHAMLDALRTLINNGSCRLYSSATAQPATASDAVPGGSVVVATITAIAIAAVTFGANYVEVTLTGTVSDASADASGTAAWFRWSDASDAGAASTGSAGEPRIDGSVSNTGGGGDLQLSSTTIVAGNPVNLTSFAFRLPTH